MPEIPADAARARVTRARMEKLAWLLDGAVPVPGTKFRFGLDSIIGLIPGIGDAIGLLLGAAILYESVRVGVPRGTIVKMVGNSVADTLGGLVPVVGDLFDFAFKSNKRNAALLMSHLDIVDARPATAPARRGSRVLAILLVAGFLGAAIGVLWWAVSRILGLLSP